MAGKRSGFRAYFGGLIVGAVFSAILLALASWFGPPPGGRDIVVAAAPPPQATPQPTAKPAPEPAPRAAATPEPEPEPQPAPKPEPKVEPKPAPKPAPAPQPAPKPAPAPQPAPEPAPKPQPAPTPQPAPAATPAPPATPAQNALRRNSERYLGDKSSPLLSVVLDQVGAPGQEIADVLLLPAPITLVIDAASPEVDSLIAEARDAGFEAMLSVSSTTFRGGARALDGLLADDAGVIGVATTGADLTDSPMLAALTKALQSRGMGLLDLTAPGGGASYRLASSAGLPSAPVGRRFDDATSSAAVYQALERAAFDARRTGAFVVVARPTEAVLAGLRRWMNLKANKSVDVAPLSVVLKKLQRK